jgi:hypothetical protein
MNVFVNLINRFFINILPIYVLWFFSNTGYSQVVVDASIDSARIFIGQRVGVTLEVSADRKSNVEFPSFDSLQYVTPGVEVVSEGILDTNYINDDKRMTLTRKYILTSFDSALYYIPPFEVVVDSNVYETKSLALKVYTLDVDTLNTDSIFGLKNVITPPFDIEEWWGVIYLSLLAFVLVAILVYVLIRLKDNKPILRRIKLKARIIPHKVAMKKIEQIKEDKIWQREDSKEYYTLLTDALRQYINDRYGFNAMEMTSYEIITRLENVNDEDAIKELKELFATADLVKFAKYNTLINENDRNLVNAIEYINNTKIEEDAVQPQPEEIIVEEQTSKTAKLILVICTIVTALALVGVMAYLLLRLYFLNI